MATLYISSLLVLGTRSEDIYNVAIKYTFHVRMVEVLPPPSDVTANCLNLA